MFCDSTRIPKKRKKFFAARGGGLFQERALQFEKLMQCHSVLSFSTMRRRKASFVHHKSTERKRTGAGIPNWTARMISAWRIRPSRGTDF
jgi:hypothetical protein